MTARAFLPKTLDLLPAELPIFPLTGALLLPMGHLPLNIFEPRYIAMVTDALRTPQRLIGMVQSSDQAQSMGEAPVHGLGCAGRISAFSENDEGTILITLTGVIRFCIEEELPLAADGYRCVRADFSRFGSDLSRIGPDPQAEDSAEANADGDVLRASVIDATKRYFDAKGFSTDWDGINNLGLAELVTSLGMACPFDPMEKQALLEAQTVEEQARTLAQILTMAPWEYENNAAANWTSLRCRRDPTTDKALNPNDNKKTSDACEAMTTRNDTNTPAAARLGLDPCVLELLVCPLTKATLHYDRDAQELVGQAGWPFRCAEFQSCLLKRPGGSEGCRPYLDRFAAFGPPTRIFIENAK